MLCCWIGRNQAEHGASLQPREPASDAAACQDREGGGGAQQLARRTTKRTLCYSGSGRHALWRGVAWRARHARETADDDGLADSKWTVYTDWHGLID